MKTIKYVVLTVLLFGISQVGFSKDVMSVEETIRVINNLYPTLKEDFSHLKGIFKKVSGDIWNAGMNIEGDFAGKYDVDMEVSEWDDIVQVIWLNGVFDNKDDAVSWFENISQALTDEYWFELIKLPTHAVYNNRGYRAMINISANGLKIVVRIDKF